MQLPPYVYDDREEFRIKAICGVGSSNGTLAGTMSLIREMCGIDPDMRARHFGYGSFEVFLESEFAREKIKTSFSENGSKIYSLLPDPRYNNVLAVIESTNRAKAAKINRNKIEKERDNAQLMNQQRTKKFRYEIAKIVRDLNGQSEWVKWQRVQDTYQIRFDKPLNKDCLKLHCNTKQAAKAIDTYLYGELKAICEEATGNIDVQLKHSFEQIKSKIIGELKDIRVDTTKMEKEPVEPQNPCAVNMNQLDNDEKDAIAYFSQLNMTDDNNEEEEAEGGGGEPAPRVSSIAHRAMLTSMQRTHPVRPPGSG